MLSFIVFTSCEREISDAAVPATFPSTAEVFTDNPVGLTDEFFESFNPAEGYNTLDTFEVVDDEAYQGTSSIRIDVPSPDNPNGFLAGGIFRDRGEGRDLSGYDAMTFWAKATTTATLARVGFGQNFEGDQFSVARTGIELTTNWKKYVVPIPNPSKLTQERGLFSYIAAPYDVLGDGPNGNEIGWTFWLDEIKFENLGTVALTGATIFGGFDISQTGFTGSSFGIGGTTSSFNLADGQNVDLATAASYFDFSNTDPTVAEIDFDLEEGSSINIIGNSGTTTITASLDNSNVDGSLEVTSSGPLPFANIPIFPESDVKAVYSDTYENATTINFSPDFGGSTTSTQEFTRINPGNDNVDPFQDSILLYANNNFTGIIFPENTVDATALTFMNVDIFVQEPNVSIEFQIRDIGTNGEINTNIFTGQPEEDDVDFRFTVTNLIEGQWNTIPIPLSGALVNQKDNIGAIILAGGPNFILDNIFFYIPE
jgi:hypothetical protein